MLQYLGLHYLLTMYQTYTGLGLVISPRTELLGSPQHQVTLKRQTAVFSWLLSYNRLAYSACMRVCICVWVCQFGCESVLYKQQSYVLRAFQVFICSLSLSHVIYCLLPTSPRPFVVPLLASLKSLSPSRSDCLDSVWANPLIRWVSCTSDQVMSYSRWCCVPEGICDGSMTYNFKMTCLWVDKA